MLLLVSESVLILRPELNVVFVLAQLFIFPKMMRRVQFDDVAEMVIEGSNDEQILITISSSKRPNNGREVSDFENKIYKHVMIH